MRIALTALSISLLGLVALGGEDDPRTRPKGQPRRPASRA